MNRDILAGLLSSLLYILFISGLVILFSGCFVHTARRLKMKKRLRRPEKRPDSLPGWILRLGDLASSSLEKDIPPMAAFEFIAAIFLLVFALAVRSFTFIASLLAAAVAAGLPLVLLFVRLSDRQSKSSREGIALVTEINRQYRLAGRNIYQALENTVGSEGDYPICRKYVYRLLLHLRSAASPEEIRRACDSFSFALGTVWGSMLATCIRVSAQKGSDVSEGLTDIAEQLRQANKRAEERKRLNSEATRMTVFLVPLMYLGTMGLSVSYLKISPVQLMKNQFMTREGLAFFLISAFLFLFNIAVLRLIGRTKLDY